MERNHRMAAMAGLSWEPPARRPRLHFITAVSSSTYRCLTCGLTPCTAQHRKVKAPRRGPLCIACQAAVHACECP